MSEHTHHDRASHYRADSLSLTGAVAMGTGVMIGAGIFALTGQVTELAGRWFSLAFLAAAVVTALGAYTYVKLSNAYPSAGGIAMFLEKAYGKSTMTGTAYVVAAFAAGSRLTRLQLLTVNFCFLLSAGAIGLLSFFLFQRFLALVLSVQTLQTEVPQVPLIDFSWFIAALYVALVLGSLIFMTNVRRQRMGND